MKVKCFILLNRLLAFNCYVDALILLIIEPLLIHYCILIYHYCEMFIMLVSVFFFFWCESCVTSCVKQWYGHEIQDKTRSVGCHGPSTLTLFQP